MENFTIIVLGIAVLFVLLCLTIFSLLYVSGILKSVDVGAGAPPIKEVLVAYKYATGSYKNSGALFCDVARLAPASKPIGIYYDDPNQIATEKLRYIVGAILSENGVKVETELKEAMLAEGFKIIKLPEVSSCVKTKFPYVSTISILIAVWKVYPEMGRYIKKHELCAYPMLEIYDSSEILFMAPLAKQEDFFVPESLEDVPELEESHSDEKNLNDSLEDSGSLISSCNTSMSRGSDSLCSVKGDIDSSRDDEIEAVDSTQDDEVTSSIDVRKSKACTNLLDDNVENSEFTHEEIEDGGLIVDSGVDSTSAEDKSNASLQDSGICSGRTSVAAMVAEVRNMVEVDDNDSSSSFEEIHIEKVTNNNNS